MGGGGGVTQRPLKLFRMRSSAEAHAQRRSKLYRESIHEFAQEAVFISGPVYSWERSWCW
jgi:hypothetical protein